ncbi:shikimate dehydrogenase [Corynebacterium sp. TAE3-ERU2]|uniref:shikimate dehydrogenase n=1 Tax=Corynebacterium sp. TAE3-ERU2 TaxID=2849497 RepID=UPI001C4543CA|nr:shikimate dehydrogenase [Corynebacterium sp. TAE3-ERU2]MBV7302716.1 shikimate dehydrogenase [Corynebacterium sp. TAE3-ERU2]
MADMPRAAVLGSPIAHSLSPVLHNAGYQAAGLSQWSYSRRETVAEEMATVMAEAAADPEIAGFSVTMPCKFEAAAHAVERSPRARAIGSANTLVRCENGWRADNTDVEGIYGGLGVLGVELAAQPVVVIGGGGTARPAIYAAGQLGAAEITVINRSDKTEELRSLCEAPLRWLSWEDTTAIAEACRRSAVVISTVPAAVVQGKEEHIAHAPIFDVIYDPWPTPLVAVGRQRGLACVGGLSMLAFQALSQFEQFTGVAAPKDSMVAALAEATGVSATEIAGAG